MGNGGLIQILVTALPVLSVGAAVWRGGEQRRAGVAVGLAWVASWLVTPLHLPGPSFWLFSIDAMLALWLTLMTRPTGAPWQIFTAASAVLLVINHIAFATIFALRDWAFFSISWVWSLLVLAGLLWGALSPRRERPGV